MSLYIIVLHLLIEILPPEKHNMSIFQIFILKILSLHLEAVGENANYSNYACLGSLVITTQGGTILFGVELPKEPRQVPRLIEPCASTADVAVNIF